MFYTNHDAESCPICAIERGEYCLWGKPGCACAYENLPTLTAADLGLTDAELQDLLAAADEYLGDEAESELSRVIGEVRVGNILLPDEGDTLVQALVEEEQAHANTLADLGDAEDRIAELERELELKNSALELAIRTLDLAARTMERQNQQARATILAGNLFASIYI